MKTFLDFLKYNNAAPFIFLALILGAGTALATSPKLRQSVFAPEALVVSATLPVKTDTSRLLKEDLKDFDLVLRIDALTEDTASYYVSYSYRTLEVVDNAWQEVRKKGKMEISRQLLGKRDLKIYLTEQIGQVIDREITYLGEAQRVSRATDIAKKSSKYASLVGQDMKKKDVAEASTSGAASAKEDVQETKEGVTAVETETASAETLLSKEEIRDIIVAAVADFLAVDTSMPDTIEMPTEEVLAPDIDSVPDVATPEVPAS